MLNGCVGYNVGVQIDYTAICQFSSRVSCFDVLNVGCLVSCVIKIVS